MKTIILLGLGAIVIGFGAYATITGNVGEVMKPDVIEVTTEVSPDWATDEEAVQAAQAVIRKKELQAKEADIKARREALKAEYEASDSQLASELEEVRSELSFY